tara:strand:+ start:600 stop:938 length:339 start_codon:yes stop_codon:yes gene_type:complete
LATKKQKVVYRNRPKAKVRHKRKFTLPLAAIVGFAPLINLTWHNFQAGGAEQAFATATRIMTGYDPRNGQFHFGELRYGLAPMLMGLMIHKGAQMLGVNRMLSNANVPLLRV